MELNQLKELYYITANRNIQSVLRHGILSFNRAKRFHHISLAHSKVQKIREKKKVPGGAQLHDYANLYICARNPMLFYLVKNDNPANICVLRINSEVIYLNNVVISDRNAARYEVRFAPAPEGLGIIDYNKTFARYWTNSSQLVAEDLKARKCAEVLVPNSIDSEFVIGAFVANEQGKRNMENQNFSLPISFDSDLFFL